jgi:FdrA protein
MVIASAALGPIASNIPLDEAPRLADPLAVVPADDGAPRHTMVDFGDDELTRGRPHPMIDGTLRAEWIVAQAKAAAEQGTFLVLLLDVVLGHGAAPDPAADLVPALTQAATVAADVGFAAVVSLCGTEGDPQGLDRQAGSLAEAGAQVHLSNADAARAAVALVEPGSVSSMRREGA